MLSKSVYLFWMVLSLSSCLLVLYQYWDHLLVFFTWIQGQIEILVLMLNVQEFKNNVLWEMLDSEVCLSLDTEFPNWSDFCTLLYSTLPFLSLLATKIFERLQFVCFFIKMLCLHEITCSPEKCVYSCSLSLNVLLSLLSLFFETFWIYSKEYWNFPETPCRDVCCFFFKTLLFLICTSFLCGT